MMMSNNSQNWMFDNWAWYLHNLYHGHGITSFRCCLYIVFPNYNCAFYFIISTCLKILTNKRKKIVCPISDPPWWLQWTGPDGEILLSQSQSSPRPVWATMSLSLVIAAALVTLATVTAQSPCSPSPCGLGAQCEVQSGSNAICSCPRGYTGDPFIRCDPFSSSSSSSGGCRSCQSSAVNPIRGGGGGNGGFGGSGSGSRWFLYFVGYWWRW